MKAHETKEVVLNLTAKDFSYWNEKEHGWKHDLGTYEIRIGTSSRDIHATEKITLEKNLVAEIATNGLK